jgi:hypothetical protein
MTIFSMGMQGYAFLYDKKRIESQQGDEATRGNCQVEYWNMKGEIRLTN